MFKNKSEQETRNEILDLVKEYCDTYHKSTEYEKGNRIPYSCYERTKDKGLHLMG